MPRSGKRDTELLGALLADARTDTTDEDIAATTEMFFDAIPGGKLIPIERVHEWGGQPRKAFDEARLAELAASIAEAGVLEPLVAEEQLAVTAAGPLVQARNHAVRGPDIDAIRAGRVRTLAQVEAALEEERRREHWTEGNQVRDPTHAAPSRAADVTDHAEKAEEPSATGQVRDITHLTITDDGAIS